jgi:hypothetical protein
MKYRYSIVNYMETEDIRIFYGVIVQEVKDDDTGRCKFLPRTDSAFLSTKIPDSGDEFGVITMADRLRGVDRRFNEELSRDVSIGPVELEDGTWTERRVALPGSPNLIEILRDSQPRIENHPDSHPIYPRFSFCDLIGIELDLDLEDAMECIFNTEFVKAKDREQKHGIIND